MQLGFVFETYRVVLQNLDLVENADVNADPECVRDDEGDEEILVYKNTGEIQKINIGYQITQKII